MENASVVSSHLYTCPVQLLHLGAFMFSSLEICVNVLELVAMCSFIFPDNEASAT